MKKLYAIVAFLVLSAPRAQAQPFKDVLAPQTFVAVATFTPLGTGTNVLAFQNTSAAFDVRIQRIDVVASSTGASATEPMQFWVFSSTQVSFSTSTPGTSQTYTQDYAYPYMGSAYDTAMGSFITFSTAPLSVTYDGGLPILPPFIVSNNTAPTALSGDASFTDAADISSAQLVLPHGAKRALIFEKLKLGAVDYTDGQFMVRIKYTVR